MTDVMMDFTAEIKLPVYCFRPVTKHVTSMGRKTSSQYSQVRMVSECSSLTVSIDLHKDGEYSSKRTANMTAYCE